MTLPLVRLVYREPIAYNDNEPTRLQTWVYVTLSCHNWKRSDFRYSGDYLLVLCIAQICIGRLFTA